MRRTRSKHYDDDAGQIVAEEDSTRLKEVVAHHSRNPRFHHTVSLIVPKSIPIQVYFCAINLLKECVQVDDVIFHFIRIASWWFN